MFVSPMPYKSTALRRYDIISITAVFNVNYAYGIRIQFIFFLQTLKNERKKKQKNLQMNWKPENLRVQWCSRILFICLWLALRFMNTQPCNYTAIIL